MASNRAIALPSGVTIQGVGSLQSNTFSNNVVQKNPSRITFNGGNRALFRIGECTERVTLRDIELFATAVKYLRRRSNRRFHNFSEFHF
jgi:hypothetical protein